MRFEVAHVTVKTVASLPLVGLKTTGAFTFPVIDRKLAQLYLKVPALGTVRTNVVRAIFPSNHQFNQDRQTLPFEGALVQQRTVS